MERKTCALGHFVIKENGLVHFTAEVEEPTVEQIKDYNETFIEIFENTSGQNVILVDMSRIKWVGAKQRIELGKGGKIIQEKYVDRTKRLHIVISGFTKMMFVQAVNLVMKPQVPQKVYTKIDQALIEVQKDLESLNT